MSFYFTKSYFLLMYVLSGFCCYNTNMFLFLYFTYDFTSFCFHTMSTYNVNIFDYCIQLLYHYSNLLPLYMLKFS